MVRVQPPAEEHADSEKNYTAGDNHGYAHHGRNRSTCNWRKTPVKSPSASRTPLAFLALLIGASAIAQRPNASPVSTATGPSNAPVSIIVYADLECPFSAATLPELEKVAARHPGDVRFEVRQYPLAQHEHSELAHEAALAAAAQGKYLNMVNLIQANQKQMERAQYLRYAALLHLNLAQFTRDLDSHRFAARIAEDQAGGHALGIDMTPTLFVNGTRMNGAQDTASLNDLVNRSLAATRPADASMPAPAGIESDIYKPLPAEDTAALTVKPAAMLGAAEAPVTIVEFTDFQCPFCRRAEEPLHQLLAGSGRTVRLVYRSYPLDFHNHAQFAAEAALAAGDQGNFWPMHDLLFANQSVLDREHIDGFARQLNLDMARFAQDLDTGRFRAEIAADRALGQHYGVDGTPFFFINGRGVSGIRSLPELQQAVQLALAGSNPADRTAVAPVIAYTPHFLPGAASGPADRVDIDWYIDLEATASPAIAPVLHSLSAHPAVRVALHSYALPSHPNAPLAFNALLAASMRGKFWPLYDALAGHALPADAAQARAAILAAAKSVQLDTSEIVAAFDDPQFTADADLDQQEAYRRGVRGVPVVFIGTQRIDGIQPASVYDRFLQQASGQAASAAVAQR